MVHSSIAHSNEKFMNSSNKSTAFSRISRVAEKSESSKVARQCQLIRPERSSNGWATGGYAWT